MIVDEEKQGMDASDTVLPVIQLHMLIYSYDHILVMQSLASEHNKMYFQISTRCLGYIHTRGQLCLYKFSLIYSTIYVQKS